MIEFLVMYFLISALTFVFIDYLLNSENVMLAMSMDEDAEVLNDKKVRYTALTIVSVLWFVFIPILIHNTYSNR